MLKWIKPYRGFTGVKCITCEQYKEYMLAWIRRDFQDINGLVQYLYVGNSFKTDGRSCLRSIATGIASQVMVNCDLVKDREMEMLVLNPGIKVNKEKGPSNYSEYRGVSQSERHGSDHGSYPSLPALDLRWKERIKFTRSFPA